MEATKQTKKHTTIIYQPKGKAGEYSKWAANFYNGCSNRCEYCYNRHCPAKDLLGKDEPTLKKRLGTPSEAYDIFKKELTYHRERIIADGGLFFNFVSDPCLPETWGLNWLCIQYALFAGVPCRLLTKRAEVAEYLMDMDPATSKACQELLYIGFTLTGCDELEPGASPNAERIHAMQALHDAGMKTWASIEPVINLLYSYDMVRFSIKFCDEYKIGLLSGKKSYSPSDVRVFKEEIGSLILGHNKKVVWKESVLKYIDKA